MRILYITLENLSLHKGSVVHIKEVVSRLRKFGHQVGLISRTFDGFSDVDIAYNIHRQMSFLSKFIAPKIQSYFFSSILLFVLLFKILPKYDIIYARDYHTVILAYLARLVFRKKLVFEINGLANEEQALKGNSFFNRVLVFNIRLAERIATIISDRIVSVTSQIASYLVYHYNCQPQKVEVVSNGVNTEKFYPILSEEGMPGDLRKKWGIEKDDTVITFIGNLIPSQGIESLIEVAPILLKNLNKIKFLIVGDGILKGQFKKKVADLGLLKHFIFTGMVDYLEIPIYINISDICVLFKRKLSSGWAPIKVFEYMACGKPVISSRVDGLEFIETEGVGILTAPGDLGEIKDALLRLIKEPQSRIEMGKKGLRLARERFDWNLKVSEIEKILKKMA